MCQSIYTLLTTGKGRLDAIYPALLAILNNIAAYVQNIGRASSSKLLQLFASMSSPSFLFANENNHTLLHSLLEVLNAMIEHQYQHNPNLVYAIVRSRKRFQALRDFTLESGQEEIERQNQQRKEGGEDLTRTSSIDSLRSPTVARTPTLGNASIASSVEDSVPSQVRGMSEKARGKMPVGQPAFSRQNSMTSLHSAAGPALATNEFFTPSVPWVSELNLSDRLV